MVILPPVEEPPERNVNYILYWNHIGLEFNRLTHSVRGPQAGPPLSARALAILHLAIHDAYFAIKPDQTGSFTTYLTRDNPFPPHRLPEPLGANDPRAAVAGAAITVLRALYTRPAGNIASSATNRLSQLLEQSIDGFPDANALSSSYRFGVAVGEAMLNLLAIRPDEPGVSQDGYRPTQGPYRFQDDPINPVTLVPVDPNNPNGPKRAVRIYHAPFYGMTAKRLAVQMEVDGTPTEHIIADPPVGFSVDNQAEYTDSIADLIRMGGEPALNSTRRRPDQTAGGFYWAYDGSNLLGTPPRFYNQILREIAWNKMPSADPRSDATNADFARLFALANVAMADAGIFSWREKYCFEFWRPISGVREEDGPLRDPFWRPLGAPATNTNSMSFTPPFPAYPSGHATFGGAVFQIARLHYKKRDQLSFGPGEPDQIGFKMVSEELNGISRDLYQPYNPSQPITDQPGEVRTRDPRHFPSLWAAIFENAVSRVWLGVHWRFDAFAAQDVHEPSAQGGPPYRVNEDGTTAYMDVENIRYKTTAPRHDRPGRLYPVGGVPLGLNIANDIFGSNLKPTPPDRQPTGRDRCGSAMPSTSDAVQQMSDDSKDDVRPKGEEL